MASPDPDSPSDVEPLPPKADTPSILQDVLVIMPFGGEDRVAARKSILEFMRIKYIVEQKVRATRRIKSRTLKILFSASVFSTGSGNIPAGAFSRIIGADLVIALITEKNSNVIYELALRSAARAEFVLIVKDNPNYLPIYLQAKGFVHWAEQDVVNDVQGNTSRKRSANWDRIQDTIDDLAAKAEDDLPLSFGCQIEDIPEDLRRDIERYDKYLIQRLENAIQDAESVPPPLPLEFLRPIVNSLDPGQILCEWTTYVPFCIVRMRWRCERDGEYNIEDLLEEPVVNWANDSFLELFNVVRRPDPYGSSPLTSENLAERIKAYMNPDDYQKYLADQQRLFDEIVLRSGLGSPAQVPLRFNAKHPSDTAKHNVFLPVLMARRAVGNPRQEHNMFLLTILIRGAWQMPEAVS